MEQNGTLEKLIRELRSRGSIFSLGCIVKDVLTKISQKIAILRALEKWTVRGRIFVF